MLWNFARNHDIRRKSPSTFPNAGRLACIPENPANQEFAA